MTFDNLLARIRPRLRAIASKLERPAAFFDKEDLFQEALIHLWLTFESGKWRDKTNSYILQGCCFYLKNYMRKQQDKVPLVSMDVLMEEGKTDFRQSPASDATQQLKDNIDSQVLYRQALASGLTRQEGEILSLSLEGLTVREAGKRMGISHVRVVQLKNRIRAKCGKSIDLVLTA